ncbi:MAG: GntR family transcriptional regulator [Defluviitaleaceae bacterium]|nr:GntR family transcriptional regulator [Defluviitaleaceae bacterium]
MKKIELNRMQPIRDIIYQRIRKAILRGDFRPGERLIEEQLSRDLGTSRTPVREALRKLEVEKMVHHHPHKGVVITDVPVEEMEDLYEIRAHVESIIAKYAAQNASVEDIEMLNSFLDKAESATDPEVVSDYIDQYNHALAKISERPMMSDYAKQLREILFRMIVSTYLKPARRPDAQREHREIVAAIAAGDGELAQKLTVAHIRNAAAVLKDLEQKNDECDSV